MAKANKGKIGQLYLAVLTLVLLSLYPQCSLSQSRSIDPETQRKIEDFIQNTYFPQSGISGLGLAVVQKDGEILYSTGFGLANKEKGIPIENSTQFLIASVTKSFTSVIVAKTLHEKFPDLGESVLDTPIRNLVPEANLILNDRFRSEYTTFRDLLAHRMCLHADDITFFADSMNSTEEVVYRTRYNEETCGFRTLFTYNQQLYTVAGEMIGKVANKSYDEVVQDFLDELGLTNTAFVKGSDDFNEMPFRAMPYYVRDNETHPVNSDLAKRIEYQRASGGLFSTVRDISQYMRFHLNLGSLDGRQIVPKEVMEWVRKPAMVYPGYVFKNSDEDKLLNQFGYGLGLTLSTYNGWQVVEHGGNLAPYVSQMTLYPTQNLGIFITTNMGPIKVSQLVLDAFIFETLMGTSNATEIAMKLKEEIDAENEAVKKRDAEELRQLPKQLSHKARKMNYGAFSIVGKYGSGSRGEAEISEKFNEQTNRTELYFDHGRWFKGWLTPEDQEGIFKLNWVTDIVHDYYVLGMMGDAEVGAYVAVVDDTLTVYGHPRVVPSTFRLGVQLDLLPPIPWNSDSCGPESCENT